MTQIGIIGGGNISETHARAVREIEGVGIAAIYGHNREKTARLGHLYGGTVYDSLPSFLEHNLRAVYCHNYITLTFWSRCRKT